MKYLPPSRRGGRLGAALALTAAASLTFAACGGGGNTGTPRGEASASGGGGDEDRRHADHQDQHQPLLHLHAEGRGGGRAKANSVTHHDGRRARRTATRTARCKAIEAAVARGDKGILITPNGPGVNAAIETARRRQACT